MHFTPSELAAEHARAMRIVRAVLDACDARRATASAARTNGLTTADGRWVLAIGKAAIGMAEGLADTCGLPDRHLIITVDGPQPDRLTNILRSDHPLPTQRSLDAGQAVKRFIEEAKAANAPSITALISGGASSLICEPIPGIELNDYRAAVQVMLTTGQDIQRINIVRRAIDSLKGGGLALLASPIPIDLFVISDVVGNTLHDIGSGPFVYSPTSADVARLFLTGASDLFPECSAILESLACKPRGDTPQPPRRSIMAMDNAVAVAAAAEALRSDGFAIVSRRDRIALPAQIIADSARTALHQLAPRTAISWGGEWPTPSWSTGVGGRCQFVAYSLWHTVTANQNGVCLLTLATDGLDGTPPPQRPAAAGAFLYSGMSGDHVPGPGVQDAGQWYQDALNDEDPAAAMFWWAEANSYHVIAHRDEHRRPGEPPSHIFTGPTGTNVNDLLIAWRV